MASIFDNLTDAEIEAVLSAQKGQQAALPFTSEVQNNIFETPVVKSVEEGTGTNNLTPVGPTVVLPPFTTNEKPVGALGFGTYDPDIEWDPELRAPELRNITPGISPGEGVGGATGGPIATVTRGDTTKTVVFDDIVRGEINREIALLGQQGIPSNDPRYGTRIMEAANRGVDIYGILTAPARNVNVTPGTGTTSQQGGVPLVLPIPGLDPTTAAILTAAGLIFSGGRVAKLKLDDPLGSLAGAAQGTVKTGQNVIDVITGETNLGEIWDPGSTGAPSGGTGAAASGTAGAGQQTSGLGSLILVGAGGQPVSGGQTGPFVGPVAPSQQQTAGGSVSVAPGALGGQTTASTTSTTISTSTSKPSGDMPNTGGPYITGGISAADQKLIDEQNAWLTDIMDQAAANRKIADEQNALANTPITINWGGSNVNKPDALPNETDTSSKAPGITPSGTTPSTTSTGTGAAATPIVISPITGGYNLPAAGTPAARNLYTEAGTTLSSLASPMQQFQIGVDATGKPIYGTVPQTGGRPSTLSEAIAQGYGGLAQGMTQSDIANLLQAIGAQTGQTIQPGQAGGYQAALTSAANQQTAAANAALRLGNIMDAEALAARAQALRQQANPELFGAGGALPQYTQQAREQVARDVAALRTAEAGQLTPEQIRNAQQAAREAYGARGQVFSQGAAAQEVLNRQQMIQQQQQLARQNLAQSMGQLGQGVAYQTANIFDPMAATLGAQYGMQSQNVGLNQALYNQAMGLTSGAGGYGFAQQMINPFSGYAQDVYGTNVNALNAAQIAQANRQAALEAAKMGQTGTYAQALGNLIASGGLGQIQSGITGGVQGLLNLLGGKWPTS